MSYAIRKRKMEMSKYKDFQEMKIGKTYKLNETIQLSTRMIAQKGSVISLVKRIPALDGSRIIIKPISGMFALTVHSSYFKESTKKLCGDSSKFYELNILLGLLGMDSFGDNILFNDYHGTMARCELMPSQL